MLNVERVSKRLDAFALCEVSFAVPAGAYVVLLGASGAGKSVLLEMIAGLVRPDSGHVRLDGRDITAERIQRRGIGLVYQDRALFPHLTVRRNLLYGVRRLADGGERVRRLAREIGIEHLWERRPGTLSGGEAQRVALARALAPAPRVLLLDEPLASLDRPAKLELRGVLRRLHREGQTMVHVTHDAEEALALATHLAVLEDGRLLPLGAPEDVRRRPPSAFAARFLGRRNVYTGVREQGAVRVEGVRLAVAVAPRALRPAVWIEETDVRLFAHPPGEPWDNVFAGHVRDVEMRSDGGRYVGVDIGVSIWASVADDAPAWAPGQAVWVGWRRSAVREIPTE